MASWSEDDRMLLVDEQLDTHGDIVYAMSLKTYSRVLVDRLAGFIGREVQFRTPTTESEE